MSKAKNADSRSRYYKLFLGGLISSPASKILVVPGLEEPKRRGWITGIDWNDLVRCLPTLLKPGISPVAATDKIIYDQKEPENSITANYPPDSLYFD